VSGAVGVLWGKSNAGGSVNLLVQHLLDTAAVGELIWDRYLAPVVRSRVDACCDGRGRTLFSLVCGLHDVGKASPAFQAKDPGLGARVRDAGLDWTMTVQQQRSWHHTLAGAVVVQRVLRAAGWGPAAVRWVWPLVAGHHGVVPNAYELRPAGRDRMQGVGAWVTAQDEIVGLVGTALGVDLSRLEPRQIPRRAEQLALLGAVIVADWVASDEKHFQGVADLAEVSMAGARRRAERAWERLGLRGGWDPSRLPVTADPVKERFGVATRPGQAALVELAEGIPSPGLLILEAPMGEGKTEAALAAVEVLARRFGADGVFVGMPTQATSDPMFGRVKRWADALQPGLPVGLLHGKRRFNKEWHELLHGEHVRFDGIDEYGCVDEFGTSTTRADSLAPAEWFLGRKRGLLMPLVVGTVDQLLHAATRTRHVMLRHAGLAGRVVVLDEVHAYDVYMAQFLTEALRWLADAGVPVILLSATLPPTMRTDLVRAYVQGASLRRDVEVSLPPVDGYPAALAVTASEAQVRCAAPWRMPVSVRVEVLDEQQGRTGAQVTEVLSEALRDGGCALVVHNTVRRAQQTYLAVREVFGDDAVLLHARLAMGERVDRAERVLRQLGPPGKSGSSRPRRLVVVATQLAEQSFDVDADLLITDLAPVDLLLQRLGRLHRHERSGSRPAPVASPRVVVTGLARTQHEPPWLPPGSRSIYGDHLLLRTAAMVMDAQAGNWTIPHDVPGLVATAYSDEPVTPAAWADAVQAARGEWQESQENRAARAAPFLLAGEDAIGQETLAGLHDRSTHELPDDDAVAAVVRDGDPSVEVVLVRHDGRSYQTLDGRSMGVHGEAVSDEAVLERVLRSTIRLPALPDLTAAAERDLRPLTGWACDPWLSETRALPLDDSMSAVLDGHRVRYDQELGLLHERPRAASSHPPA
jgi:CRISPR-associated endonuclease/helicase Cas3